MHDAYFYLCVFHIDFGYISSCEQSKINGKPLYSTKVVELKDWRGIKADLVKRY